MLLVACIPGDLQIVEQLMAFQQFICGYNKVRLLFY